jgi:hypothetical protein
VNKINAISQSITKYNIFTISKWLCWIGGEIWGIKYRKMPNINNKYNESNGVKTGGRCVSKREM